jgi:hypothetical protein
MKLRIIESGTLKILRSYLIAGKLLHFITLIEILAIVFLIPLISKIDAGSNIIIIGLKLFATSYVISLPLFAQLDARSRFQNYKQIKDQIFIYGFDKRIFKPVLKSRCQRDAAWLSAKELGHGEKCRIYFYLNGYRWFHLFPDFVFSNPQFIFTSYFWKTTFFSSKYVSKIDYTTFNPGDNILKVTNYVHSPAN